MDRRYWAGFLKIFLPLLLLVGGGGALIVYTQHKQAFAQRSAAEAASISRAVNGVETRFNRSAKNAVFCCARDRGASGSFPRESNRLRKRRQRSIPRSVARARVLRASE